MLTPLTLHWSHLPYTQLSYEQRRSSCVRYVWDKALTVEHILTSCSWYRRIQRRSCLPANLSNVLGLEEFSVKRLLEFMTICMLVDSIWLFFIVYLTVSLWTRKTSFHLPQFILFCDNKREMHPSLVFILLTGFGTGKQFKSIYFNGHISFKAMST